MKQVLRYVSFAALVCAASIQPLRSPAHAGDCRPGAIDRLRALAPDGFSIYQRVQDKNFFIRWITCDDVASGLATAVHESVHAVTADEDVFPLVNGGDLPRPHEVSGFFAPSLIARKFKPSDFVSTYLRSGTASSGTDFLYLLDELNAYSHDLNAAIDLKDMRSPDEEVDRRDGLAALMAFVAIYVQTAEDSEPATWSGLQKPEVAKTLADLWGHAEGVMQSSCGIPNFGSEDKRFIRQFCAAKAQSAMERILGRAPICPTTCITSPEGADASGEIVEETTAGKEAPIQRSVLHPVLRPFWSRATTHHSPRPVDPAMDPGTAR